MLSIQPGYFVNQKALCQFWGPIFKSFKHYSHNNKNSRVISQCEQSTSTGPILDNADIWKQACEITDLILPFISLKDYNIKDAKQIIRDGQDLLSELQRLDENEKNRSDYEKERPKFTVNIVGTLLNSYHHPAITQKRYFTSRSGRRISIGRIHQEDENVSRYPILDKIMGQEKKNDAVLKKLLTEENLPPGLRDKLKIAFGEGYLAGKTEPSKSWRSTLAQFVRACVVIALVYWAFVSLSVFGGVGPNVRINMLKGDRYEVNPEDINITFDDVKGVDEAKQELQDIVDFLRDPDTYTACGAKLPKGVLLVGPPGIGKTLLARAVAGEANVPFFHASGSEFDELFVGTGAKRVRQLFEAAKARSPCVIFIDEIDTVGAKRTSSQIHPYANQTINQLLAEMDGFAQTTGVIVLGATNRRDNLDKALLRPGRFDVEVRVFAPDFKGRRDILAYYLSKLKVVDDIDIDKLAHGTTGCTGADLENIANQAALKAARESAPAVTMQHLEFAKDKVFMGPAKKTRIPDEDTNLMTAFHEAGHTLVAYYTNHSVPINKVTIIPRGLSLGHTSFIPDKEEYNLSKCQLMARMDVAMGGRAAEELIYGQDKVTTGAGSDFSMATNIATSMVKQYGMSEKVGFRTFDDDTQDGGLAMIKTNDLSPATREMIDSEIQRLLSESYSRAMNVLKTHSKEHKALANSLMKYETLDLEEIKAIVGDKH